MKNYVEIYEDGKLINRGYNLVVLSGRTFLMNRLLGSASTQGLSLSYFAVGNGGGDPANPLLPINPSQTDTGLYAPMILGSNYPGGGIYKPITSVEITSPTSCVVTLDVALTDLSTYGYCIYNEIGLFVANPSNPTTFMLYAHICMSAQKDPTRAQTLYWNLFF